MLFPFSCFSLLWKIGFFGRFFFGWRSSVWSWGGNWAAPSSARFVRGLLTVLRSCLCRRLELSCCGARWSWLWGLRWFLRRGRDWLPLGVERGERSGFDYGWLLFFSIWCALGNWEKFWILQTFGVRKFRATHIWKKPKKMVGRNWNFILGCLDI